MAGRSPPHLTAADQRGRLKRVTAIAKRLGFVGVVEYRHAYSQAGGAQYGRGVTPEKDLLIVYAEAFDRDADLEDFSLTAIIAHERGHQLLARHPRIAKRVQAQISHVGEEIVASILGAMICEEEKDSDDLTAKATAELIGYGDSPETAIQRLQNLRNLFEALL